MGLFYAIWYENSTVLIISPTERQSQMVFRKMKQFLNKAKRGQFSKIVDGIIRETQHILEWENGSIIHALPVTQEGANIRGFTSNFVIIDEGELIDDSAFSAINPMLATTGGKMWMVGTFKGVNNEFYRTWIDGKKKGFTVHTFPSRISPLITEEFLEGERGRLSTLEYQQEYEAKAIDEADTYFTIGEIENCQRDYSPTPLHPSSKYFLGFDPARMGEDEGCALILENAPVPRVLHHTSGDRTVPPFKIKRIYEMRNKTINEQIGFIKKLHSHWNFQKIYVDDTGLGGGVTDELMKDQYPVEGVVFSIKSKEELYSHCKIQMQNNMVSFPKARHTDLNGEKLKKQLNEIKYEYQKGSGFIKLFPATKHAHDDYVSSLVLSLWGTKTKAAPILFATGKGTFIS